MARRAVSTTLFDIVCISNSFYVLEASFLNHLSFAPNVLSHSRRPPKTFDGKRARTPGQKVKLISDYSLKAKCDQNETERKKCEMLSAVRMNQQTVSFWYLWA